MAEARAAVGLGRERAPHRAVLEPWRRREHELVHVLLPRCLVRGGGVEAGHGGERVQHAQPRRVPAVRRHEPAVPRADDEAAAHRRPRHVHLHRAPVRKRQEGCGSPPATREHQPRRLLRRLASGCRCHAAPRRADGGEGQPAQKAEATVNVVQQLRREL